MRKLTGILLFGLVSALGIARTSGATHFVNVSGLTFSPSNLTVANGDTVIWNGLVSFHTVTPNAGVTEPFCGDTVQNSCTATFLNNGSFGYHCNPHQSFGMVGVVNVVAAPGVPPSISITNPLADALFAAPGAVSVGVSAIDSDGSVTSVQLMTNGVFAATNTSAPFGFALSNLAAGNYALRARATDNQALSSTSAAVNIRVATRPLLTAVRTNSPVTFSFDTRAGVNYLVEGSANLTNFSTLVTNAGTGTRQSFTQTNPTPDYRFFRLRLE